MSLVERHLAHDGAWLRLVLATPPANVLTMAMVQELREAVAAAAAQPDLKLISVEGTGVHFSYGASVPEHLPPDVTQMLPGFHALIRELLDAPAPTAALVRGRCLGGGFELALACDAVFAAEDARLGVPEITLGVFPPAAAALLPLRVGSARATQAVLTGEVYSACWWEQAGLATLTPPGDGVAAAVDQWFARNLAPRSAVALRHAARASRAVLRQAALPVLDALERDYLGALISTHDGLEGCTAFAEKRTPVWTNR